ncbi:hypothetical protein C8R44DRAFT_172017 [Mycena epipterygia]|nr:hypothetical protein C8R44DRAFT_172017 [Mycena epipterygia]
MANTTQYRTGKTLSVGTQATYTVKEAIHVKTGKRYACKIVSKNAMQGRVHSVRNEIAVLRRVSGNANIVKLHYYFQTSHSVYLCLDLCTGNTLFNRIVTKGTYSESKAADLIRTILVAVQHIHDSGIVHRDLNPNNLLFRSPRKRAPIMIADFGFSRMLEDIPHPDEEPKVYGAPRYMAPEIFQDTEHGKPVDVWGVGLLAFFIIAGCMPFDRGAPQLEREAVIAGEYKFTPENKWGSGTVNAQDFISICLAMDPGQRPTAGEALAHTWVVPATPRFALVKSRASSLLEEFRLPSFRRVFNPKRKWRSAVFVIKALNRMQALAGHRPLYTQQDTEESAEQLTTDSSSMHDSDSEYENYPVTPVESGIENFPSPVSSIYSFSDQESWLTRTSISTVATDADTSATISTQNDPSEEPRLPILSPAPSTSEKQTSQNTTPFSSTPSSVYSPDVQQATSAESTSPQAADNTPISTFVIFSMNTLSADRAAVEPEDIQMVENKFPDGGMLVSAHTPTRAEAWVEDHYDDPLLESARSAGLRGPIAAMLSPDEAALVVFGSILDDGILTIARTLASASGFAVMVRPIGDDPVQRLAGAAEMDDEALGEISDSESSDSDSRDGNSDESEDGGADRSNRPIEYSVGPAMRIRGGRGDDSDEEDNDFPWNSKTHKAVVWLKLWPDEKHKYFLNLRTKTRFRVQPEYSENGESQSEVIGYVHLNVETPEKILPDRSYTSLGFLAHRQNSLIDREFIDCGFDHPDQIRKTIDQKSTQKAVAVNAGSMNLHPAAGVSGMYGKTRSKTVELADNKPTPRCHVLHEAGERWNKDGKSYTSYDITTVPTEDSMTGMKHPLKPEFAMGINILPEDAGLPKMSFITRNQVIIWVSDPTLKAKVRGLLVLMTTYIPNIQARRALIIQEDLDIHLATDTTQNNMPPPAPIGEKMALSLSIAPIKTDKARKKPLIDLFTNIGRKAKEPTLADLRLREYISRGWDPTNKTWRSVLWTSLDENFRNTDPETSSAPAVWKLDWNPQEQEEPDWDEFEEEEPQNDVVDPLGLDGGKEKLPAGGVDDVIAGPSMTGMKRAEQ